MCSTTFKLQEKKSLCCHISQDEPARSRAAESGCGWHRKELCVAGKNKRHRMVRLPAGRGAQQTKNCRSKMTLGSESGFVFSDLRMGSCICSVLTPLFVSLVCNGQAGKVGEPAHPDGESQLRLLLAAPPTGRREGGED